MSDITEVLEGIRGLAKAIHKESGRYVAYTEDMHSTTHDVSVWIQDKYGPDAEFEVFRGSESPMAGYSVTHERMREELGNWLADYRKEQEAA